MRLQLLTTACYIDLNPVAAGLKSLPEQWPWSSYRAHVGLEHPQPLLAAAEFLGPHRAHPGERETLISTSRHQPA